MLEKSAQPIAKMSGSDQQSLLLSFFGVILFLAACFVAVFVLRKILSILAMKYAVKNKEKLTAVDPKFFKNLAKKKKKIIDFYGTYETSLSVLGLDRTIRCSNSVVVNAENNPVKYVLKYSKINNDKLSLRILDFLKGFSQEYGDFLSDMNEAGQKMLTQLPWIFRSVIDKKRLPYVVCETDYSLLKDSYRCLRFLYVSPAGRSSREYSVAMSSNMLSRLGSELSKGLTKEGHKKAQRSAMTNDLREAIKKRDDYTCQKCGNSVYKEPNLLLEVDHIVPISKGGKTEASNLQTLCWRCNREKGDKKE